MAEDEGPECSWSLDITAVQRKAWMNLWVVEARVIQCCQECVVHAPWVAFALRPSVGQWIYVAICGDDLGVDELNPSKYLAFKERLKSEYPAARPRS